MNATAKHCSMAFVVNVTDNGERYDISYGKCLKPKSGRNKLVIQLMYMWCA